MPRFVTPAGHLEASRPPFEWPPANGLVPLKVHLFACAGSSWLGGARWGSDTGHRPKVVGVFNSALKLPRLPLPLQPAGTS